MVKVDPAQAETVARDAISAGVLEDKDILISKGFENEMWLMFNWGDCGANASLVTMLKGFKDPRLKLYFTKNTQPIVKPGAKPLQVPDKDGKMVDKKDDDGFLVYAEEDYLTDPDTGEKLKPGTAYIGIPAGCAIGGKPNQYSNYSGWAGTFSMPQPIMFAAEGWFLRAEAELRWPGIGSEDVKTLYENGIRTSIKNSTPTASRTPNKDIRSSSSRCLRTGIRSPTMPRSTPISPVRRCRRIIPIPTPH